MSRFKTSLLAASLLAGSAGLALAQPAPTAPPSASPAAATAPAATGPTYDLSQLPAVQGHVAEYTLTPRGDVDGFVLDNGTEVHFPPFMSDQLIFAVRPGDAVTVHGLKARVLPMVMAMSITNDATHTTVAFGADHMAPRGEAPVAANGAVKLDLHGPRGELNGVVLADGTIVRLPPPDAERMASQLAVGQTVYVSGPGVSNVFGRVIDARQIGPSQAQMTQIKAPPMHGGPGRRGPGGRPGMGPDAGPPPPPPPARP